MVRTVNPAQFPPTASSSRNASRLVDEAIQSAVGTFRGDRQQAKAAVNAGWDPRVAVKSLSPNLMWPDETGQSRPEPDVPGTTTTNEPSEGSSSGVRGGGTTTPSNSQSSDSSMLYILLAAVIVGGAIVWSQ